MTKLLAAVFAGSILLCCVASASTGPSRGALPSELIYEEQSGTVEGSTSIGRACVTQNDHPHLAGGGIVLPFNYDPSRLLNNGPREDGWSFFIEGKGIETPTPYTDYAICSFVPTNSRTKKFSVPADGKAHSKTISCVSGERAISGGMLAYAGSPGADDHRAILESYPVDGPDKGKGRGDAWRVTTRATKHFSMKASAGVVCVKKSDMRVQYKHFDFVSHEKDFDGVYVDCDSAGDVTGGGPQLEKPKNGMRLTTSAPFDTGADEDSTPSDRWATGLDGPNKGKADVRAWAACVKVTLPARPH